VTDSDVVPEQVKDWLTSTFTRSLTNVRRRGDERLKFRSVANAIRAGIVVDRCAHYASNYIAMYMSGAIAIMQIDCTAVAYIVSAIALRCSINNNNNNN